MGPPVDKLADYNARRDFSRTAEPPGRLDEPRPAGLRFVVQKHDATRLHYDFRLEWQGVLLSWAVTKGPSADIKQKRLAVRTEDHPLDYGNFEGVIPKGDYGGGTVMLWDEGLWLPKVDPDNGLKDGNLKFVLHGHRMKGAWVLVRMKPRMGEKRENWLLIKERDNLIAGDPDGLTNGYDASVRTGRTMSEIALGAAEKPTAAAFQTGRRPAFRKLQLATLYDTAPEGDEWFHETKFDGYRCLAALGKGGTRLYTRKGNDWTDSFAALEPVFEMLPCKAALIDGEVVAARVSGSPFSSLQAALKDNGALLFYSFDLLSLNGTDLTKLSQIERRARLADLLSGMPDEGYLRMSEHIQGKGEHVYAAACKAGAEGIVSKRADAPYRGARTTAWRKVKCTRRQEFVVGGFAASDKRGRPFASLLLGQQGPDGLRYRGRVGTGFSDADLDRLNKAMKPQKTSPFQDVPSQIARTATWVKPELVVEVDFAEFTADGYVRQGSFLGVREDTEPAIVTPEVPQENAPVVAGVQISNSERKVFEAGGYTKHDVAAYYDKVGERLTEIAGHRPLSLLRCPGGINAACFFQKHGHGTMPAALQHISIEESDGTRGDYLYATRPQSFVAAAQMGTIEFHIWGSRTDRLDRPDRLVFDLDPDEGLDWKDVRRAASDLRGVLSDIGLEAGAMVTGGKGIHVWVPLRRTQNWKAVRGFAKTVAHVLEAKEPKRFVASMSKARRKGRIFVDWLRNERGATAVSPWSLRARANAPIAVPVAWEDLAALKSASEYTLGNIDSRLDKPCSYLAQVKSLQTLGANTATELQNWIDS